MRTYYCTDSQDAIPLEYFSQGRAVWCGGKPYLRQHAERLGLKPDPRAPDEFYRELAAKFEKPKPKSVEEIADAPTIREMPGVKLSSPIAPLPKPEAPKPPEKKPPPEPVAKPAEKPPPAAAPVEPKAAAPVLPKPATPAPAVEKPAAAALPAKPPEAPAKPAVAPVPQPPEKPVAPASAKPAAPAAHPAAGTVPPPGAKLVPKDGYVARPSEFGKAVSRPSGVLSVTPKKEAPRILAEAHLDRGEPLTTEELLKIPIFEGIAQNQLERLPGAVVKRKFKKGDIVCREGEYGSTAFYILSGSAEVFINTPMMHVKSEKKEASTSGIFGMFRKFRTSLVGRKEDPREDENPSKFIRIDAPMDLPYDNPIAELHSQDLFGEMTCLSFYPRSATVRAKEDCEMLEMLRNVLQVLQKNKTFKEKLEKAYKERALGQHLRSVPILSGLDDSFIDQLRDRVQLEDFDPGDVIIKQGDEADAFYLIRVGCVKVSQQHPGGEVVITYLGRGEYFGEMGLLKGGKRTATCTALDHVEVVRIKKKHFDFMLSWYEGLREKFESEAQLREKASRLMTERAPSVPLDDFLGQGLMHAQSLLLLDLEKCTRCDECVRACADSHDGVTRLVREGLRFDKFLVPTSCRSCMDPVCMIGCPVGSIRRKESLEIVIEDWCIGCGICAKQCPYGNISMHSFDVEIDDPDKPGYSKAAVKEKAVTCDLCTELKEPSCVYACPHDAAHRVNAREFFIGQAEGSTAALRPREGSPGQIRGL